MAAWIVFIVFGGFGLVMLGVGVRQHLEQARLLANARSVEAEITRSEVFESTSKGAGQSGSTRTYRPDVSFRYQVGGVGYESDRIHPTVIVRTFATRDGAVEVLRPFKVGTKVRAFVDDTAPDKGFLIAEKSSAPVVFIAMGLLLPVAAWFAGRLI